MIKDKGLDFPLKGTVTLDDVKRTQERLLEMAVIVRDSFEQNGINYTLMFGTLLGAVRHQGFIPWDLDFDMGVMDQDYERAMECLSADLPDWLVLQNQDTDKNYCGHWSKVVDRNSVITSSEYESDNLFEYRGVHLDVYRLKKTSSSNYKYDLLEDNLIYYTLKNQKGLMRDDLYEQKRREIEEALASLNRNSEERSMCYFLHIFCSDIKSVFPTKKYLYEGEVFSGPNDYDRVLKDSYYVGDYMIPPEYDNRDLKISAIEFLN